MQYVSVNGTDIPALGFGTFQLEPDDARRMVAHALATGYRHIDTAQMYNNEQAVGEGIKEAGMDRESFFLTTKVGMEHFHDGDLQRSARESVEKLGTDYVDLLLLHWPEPKVDLEETLNALMDVKRQGLTRHIGVSNFTTDWLRRALEICGQGELLTNQVEYHVFLSQKPVLDAVRNAGMALTAYAPLARGKVLGNQVLRDIGGKYGKNEAQVALRWLLDQPDVLAIPKSTRASRADDNFNVLDFQLSNEDMETINAKLLGNDRQIDPSFAPEWDN
jgi:diketogulonate reductase-like aldo/keto reductase